MLAAPLFALAQVTIESPGVVGLNEQFNITFTLTEKPSSVDWTAGDDFQIVWGPQTGSSTQISIVNGKHSKVSRYTYTYVLMPRSSGKFSLPAFHAVVGGKDVYSKAPAIEVVGGGNASQGNSQSTARGASGPQPSSQSSSAQSRQAASDGETSRTSSEDVFMRLSLSRTSAVVGEPVVATLKLYTRINIAGFEDARFPSFNGFWAQETEAPQNISFQRESVGDMIYNSAVLRRWVIIPQKAGAINIDAAELVCLLQQRVRRGASIFDDFFDDYQTVRKRVTSAAYTVNVSPLPKGAPASFTGAVGSYRISASMNTDSLKVHDAASVLVTVSGTGNVALVGAPKVNFPPDSEQYDVKTSDRLESGSGGTSGTKTFEYPFIPRSHGDFEIPAVEFTYYDIKARKYVTLATEPLAYHVQRGEESDYVPSESLNLPSSSRRDVRNLADDIHYISTRVPHFSENTVFFVGTAAFRIFIAVSLVLSAAVYICARYVRRRRGDTVKVRTRGASKAARRRLSVAGSYLSKNLYGAYYEELHKALLGYAADKMNMSLADLSKDSIASAFSGAGAAPELVDEYVALLDNCEYARYAPSGSDSAMKESYEKAVEVISMLEDNMKKTPKGGAAHFAAMLVCAGLGITGGMYRAEARSDSADSLWIAAVEAYASGDYSGAAEDFTAIESMGLSSPELYTNIADSYFKTREYAKAILYYERALKLNPSFKDAKYNLEIARGMTVDRIDSVPEFFMKTWARNFCYLLPSDAWAALFCALFLLTLALVLAFLLSRRSLWRELSFFAAIVTLLLGAVCLSNACVQKNSFNSKDEAIVTAPVCSAKSTPSAISGADLFVLHEGTKVRILDVVGDWIKISIADGREAWLPANVITVI